QNGKETLNLLSNIDPIRAKYVENNFSNNKTEIIAKKTKQYNEINSERIKGLIQSGIDNITNAKIILEDPDSENLSQNHVKLIDVFESLKGDFEDFFNNKINDLNSDVVRFSNGISWLLK